MTRNWTDGALVLGALLAIISITSAAFAVHKRIEKHIDMLEDL